MILAPTSEVWRQVVAVVALPEGLRARRTSSHFLPVHPEHVSGVGGDASRRFFGNQFKIECPPEHRSRERSTGAGTSQKIRGSSGSGPGLVSNPMAGPAQRGCNRCFGRERIHATLLRS